MTDKIVKTDFSAELYLEFSQRKFSHYFRKHCIVYAKKSQIIRIL